MATLIFVHGTFAAGPEAGNKWWQEGSQFEAHMRDMLEADSGELTFERVRWDAKNSVSSRREAGKKLHTRMLELEQADEPYCVVGHSHGGSAIAAALMRAAIKRQPLSRLKLWVTVGAPFIGAKKDRFLFSRLGLFGKTVYVAITSFAVFALLASLTLGGGTAVIAVLILAVLPALVVYGLMWSVNARRFGHFRRRSLATFDQRFLGRWLGLWHKDDEAIRGLGALSQIDRPIFGKGFAVPIFSMLAIYIFPLVLYAVVSNADITQTILGYHLDHFGSAELEGIAKDGALIGDGKDLGINFNLLLTTAWEALRSLVPGGEKEVRAVFLLVVVPLTFLILSLLIVLAATLLAKPLSIALSALLNRSAWQQIRQKGFGGDIPGEQTFKSQSFPNGSSKRSAPLPEELGREITVMSDAAAAKAITKLRGAISEFALAERQTGADLMVEYLSWNELIHTTYFDSPRFRKLLAYSIAQADGFQSSKALKQDGDYDHVAGWYQRLQKGSNDRRP